MVQEDKRRLGRTGQNVGLHERVLTGLAMGFKGSVPDFPLGPSEADLLVHQGNRVAVFEVKTGDPELPLPASTSAQMLLLKERVRQQFLAKNIDDVLPVVVTNYRVTPDDQKELEEQGIKVVRIGSSAFRGDLGNFTREVANVTGLEADLI